VPAGDNLVEVEAKAFRSGVFGYDRAYNDPLGASRWMEALPDGPRKSSAWAAMVHYVSQYSPDMAFSLSAAYLDGDSRGSDLAEKLKTVSENIGLPAALELLKSPDLSAAESASLAASLKPGKEGDKP
jgi:hypothetical protein